MIYPGNQSETLDEELFLRPTVQYRGIPFWSWNCRVTEEQIDWQLDCFKEMGFGGVDIHPRTGLDIEYLGKEYRNLIRYTVKKCREKGLLCWLYDDDRFPSGCADGIVTKDWHMRERYLLLTTRRGRQDDGSFLLPGFCSDRNSFEKMLDEGGKPAGYFAAAYSMTMEDGRISEYRRLHSDDEISQALERGEQVRFAYVKLLEGENWFEGQAYVDVLNPAAVRAFIDVTHETYLHEIGDEFGRTVPAIFTDEPRLAPRIKLPQQMIAAASDQDAVVPYSEVFAGRLAERFGIDALDIAPEYVWELSGGRKSRSRYIYRNVLCDCFNEAFLDQISAWCHRHKIMMTGHVMGEESLLSQVHYLGDCMRCYRNMDLPGIDILVDERQLLTVKQAVSVSRQYGRKGTVSELYGVTNWDCNFKTYKLQGDWQAALGITVRVPHLSWMSMQGEAKRDWPGSIFYQSPWYREFSYLEDYFARLNTVLTRGNAVVRIGVIHPVESMWMHYGPLDQSGMRCKEMNERLNTLAEGLLYRTIDFDFVSEALLPELHGSRPTALASYQAIIVPGLTTIRSTTLDALEQFHRAGGKLIFMGEIPSLENAEVSGRAQRLAAESICISDSVHELLSVLEEERDVEIRKADGRYSDNLFYQLRRDGGCLWLFCCHVNAKRSGTSAVEKYVIWVRGAYDVVCYDAMTGAARKVSSRMQKKEECGWTCIPWDAYAEDSLLLRLNPAEPMPDCSPQTGSAGQNTAQYKIQYKTVQRLERIDSYSRQEKNMLLLDYAGFQVDDGPIHEKQEILRLDNEIRRELGFELRNGVMKQPWAMQERETHKVTLLYEFVSDMETDAWLGIERPESCRIYLNGEEIQKTDCGYYVDTAIRMIALPKLYRGMNYLRIEVLYHQKSNLENLYLLGDFDVEAGYRTAAVRERRKQLQIGEITRQGMPFYTGNLEYRFSVIIEEDGEYSLHVPHFNAPLLAVSADGERKGLIAFAPHRLSLGYLKAGEHVITVCLYGNRYNGFGMLHNANEENIWLGPDSYRTTGDDWTDCYCLKPAGIMSAIELESSSKQDCSNETYSTFPLAVST